MMDDRSGRTIMGTLVYNSEYNCLELDGYELQCGEFIELRVFGSWIPGQILVDPGGWYLFTLDYVGIRLHTGLPARFREPRVADAFLLQSSEAIPVQIIIVDDDVALLQALPRAILLRIPGAYVDTATSPEEALDKIHKQRYDAVVSDIKMPGMDGLELLARIRDLQPGTPTLLITGHGDHDIAVRALRGGAYDYIQKPIDRDQFIAALLRAVQTCQLRRQVEEQQRSLELHSRSLERLVQQRTHELMEANTTKDKVISLVSDELRFPVKRLKDMSDVLKHKLEGIEADELINRGFADIDQSIGRIEGLVLELLKTSRIESSMFILHRDSCDLAQLCQRALEVHCAKSSGLLTCELLDVPVTVEVGIEQIEQVLDTLLANAREHARSDKPITITLQRAALEAIIAMRDLTSPIELGSGLYVARKIIERQGGHLEIQNFPNNKSTIFIMLPLLIEQLIEDANAGQESHAHGLWTIQYNETVIEHQI
jgi:FixJ family two-component response regulator